MGMIGWVFLGLLVGAVSFLSQQRTVLNLCPEQERSIQRIVIGGAVLRWLAAGAVMLAGFQTSAAAGLSVFAGLWVSRWAALLILGFCPLKTTAEDSAAGGS